MTDDPTDATPVGDHRTLPCEFIQVPSGRRPVNMTKVMEIARSIQDVGLIHPITITPDRVLVAGLHRLEAFRHLRIPEIPVTVFSYDEARARLAELHENTRRADLSELEKGRALREEKKLYETLHPEATPGAIRANAANRAMGHDVAAPSAVTSFTTKHAAETGESDRTVRESLFIAEHIPEDLQVKILGTPLANRKKDLVRLARVKDPEKQREKVEVLIAKVSEDDAALGVHSPSKSQDWWTPSDIIDPTIAMLGEIDLDPCANEGAPNVPARQHFTPADDGLSQEWRGQIFMNPPYKGVGRWVKKLLAEMEKGRVNAAIVLVENRTGSDWYRNLAEAARVKCEIDGRLTFIDGLTGQPASNVAPFPSVVFYLSRDYAPDDRDRFRRAFDLYGAVWERLPALTDEAGTA